METPIHIKTHRFTFSDNMVDEISCFSKLHQHDDRCDFKDAWNIWTQDSEVSILIESETRRLRDTGFQGDIQQKLFKSCRYYFRNKPVPCEESVPRKQYECINKTTLQVMDQFIQSQFRSSASEKTQSVNYITITPADSFHHFCTKHQSILVDYLKENQTPSQLNIETGQNQYSKSQARFIMGKFKKTYKNRFYRIRVSMHN